MTARHLGFGCLVLVLCSGLAAAADWPQWRGPNRDAVSGEKGLLADWSTPPKKLWQITTPGEGFAAACVADGVVYITGSSGAASARVGTLTAVHAADGSAKWQTEYGPEWGRTYPNARTTPTCADGSLYLISGLGHVICLTAKDGRKVWDVDTLERFKGINIRHGIAESPLLVDKKIICHPGGPDAAVAALDLATGVTVWTTKGLSDKSSYCSPILLTLDKRRQIVTHTENSLVGIDPENGAVLWKYPHKSGWSVHANTPVALGPDTLAVSSAHGSGTDCLRIGPDGPKLLWHDKTENELYGLLSFNQRLYLVGQCFAPETGKMLSRMEGVSPLISLIGTEAGIIGYTGDGKILLIKLAGDQATIAGSFKIDFGAGPHYAHLALANRVLYVRHGNGLAAYDLKAK